MYFLLIYVFRHGHPHWGTFTLSLLLLAPFVAMLVSAKEKFQAAMWHLPILQQIHLLKKSMLWFNTFKQIKTVEVKIKHSNKEIQKIKSARAGRLRRQSGIKKVTADESLKQRLTEKKEEIESELQKFKTYEGFCEAAPQFILQGSLMVGS